MRLSSLRAPGSLALALLTFNTMANAAPLTAYRQAIDALMQAVSRQDSDILVYQFDAQHPIPITTQSAGGTVHYNGYTLNQDARLVVIPQASTYFKSTILLGSAEQPSVRPRLLIDTGKGQDSRCENDANAQVGQWKQTMELRTPIEAWQKLGEPDIAFNTNYFDVRAQKNGATWGSTHCSLPLGYYFSFGMPGVNSSLDAGQAAAGKYLLGPNMFVDKDGHTAPLHTFVIAQEHANRTIFELSDIAEVNQPAPPAEGIIYDHIKNREPLVAISGTGLIHNGQRLSLGKSSGTPDSKDSATTRIAIGYDTQSDRLFVFEGGAYRQGLTRKDLQDSMDEFGADEAVELDGGGSAAIVIRHGAARWAGASTREPEGSCPGSGAYCTPITQPDGKPRPVPGWLGIFFKSFNGPM